jgi:hypothetical protein
VLQQQREAQGVGAALAVVVQQNLQQMALVLMAVVMVVIAQLVVTALQIEVLVAAAVRVILDLIQMADQADLEL